MRPRFLHVNLCVKANAPAPQSSHRQEVEHALWRGSHGSAALRQVFWAHRAAVRVACLGRAGAFGGSQSLARKQAPAHANAQSGPPSCSCAYAGVQPAYRCHPSFRPSLACGSVGADLFAVHLVAGAVRPWGARGGSTVEANDAIEFTLEAWAGESCQLPPVHAQFCLAPAGGACTNAARLEELQRVVRTWKA